MSFLLFISGCLSLWSVSASASAVEEIPGLSDLEVQFNIEALDGSVSITAEPSKYILDFPTEDNPMGIKVVQPYNLNYFITIGDWGAPSGEDTYQRVQSVVAEKMRTYYANQKAKGYNLMFVAAVGDNFYWTGQTCDEYARDWSTMYGANLTAVPWLAIMGNHDWGNSDPTALCAWNHVRYTDPKTNIPYAANQLNADKKGCNPHNFYMPDFGYYYTINELRFELIGLDKNAVDCPGGLGGDGPSNGAKDLFANCGGSTSVGCGYLNKISDASMAMFEDRGRHSVNKNFIITQHYPGVGGDLLNQFCGYRNSSDLSEEMIVSAYGHTHSQQCDGSYDTKYGKLCNTIMTGGGGGCCSESTRRGFFVIGFDADRHMITPVQMSDPAISCWYPCGVDIDDEEAERMKFHTCCHTWDDTSVDCSVYDMKECPE